LRIKLEVALEHVGDSGPSGARKSSIGESGIDVAFDLFGGRHFRDQFADTKHYWHQRSGPLTIPASGFQVVVAVLVPVSVD
jgi:hypothetical protein